MSEHCARTEIAEHALARDVHRRVEDPQLFGVEEAPRARNIQLGVMYAAKVSNDRPAAVVEQRGIPDIHQGAVTDKQVAVFIAGLKYGCFEQAEFPAAYAADPGLLEANE